MCSVSQNGDGSTNIAANRFHNHEKETNARHEKQFFLCCEFSFSSQQELFVVFQRTDKVVIACFFVKEFFVIIAVTFGSWFVNRLVLILFLFLLIIFVISITTVSQLLIWWLSVLELILTWLLIWNLIMRLRWFAFLHTSWMLRIFCSLGLKQLRLSAINTALS
jgi:hypothetical protein